MIYVDHLRASCHNLGLSCHLIADSRVELIAFGLLLGLKLKWLQTSRFGNIHFDLTLERRQQAIELGAVDCSQNRLLFCQALRAGRKAVK